MGTEKRRVLVLGAVDIRGVRLLTGDKGDEAFMSSLLSGQEFDTVIDTVPSREHIELAFRHLNGRVEHYIICSSTGVYPPLRYVPADEEHPWREKTAVNFDWVCERDAYALSLWEEHGFPVTILRPTNIIGAGRVPIPAPATPWCSPAATRTWRPASCAR